MTLLDVLGSKSRLKILRELTDGPKYVTELAEDVDLDGKSTAHHLAVLEDAGIVDWYQLSNRKYYRLTKSVTFEATPPPERTFIVQTQESRRSENAVEVRDRS